MSNVPWNYSRSCELVILPTPLEGLTCRHYTTCNTATIYCTEATFRISTQAHRGIEAQCAAMPLPELGWGNVAGMAPC
jgi:hypothetical protein